ncbi:NUDIX domain-containing protein [Paenibacillus polysaccharolyticus]|uniref:NUDIX hydrolase n=1 Tax=Paenibacillus polysaccharolyticus TaxID=582692 RepID=UPI00203C3249|nr:NUDIX domain-containing protein [Paenibacillus polysaccharolyticus]MCM3131221.1 NUDIX domain-containing protein [Paenibacillus polysaccharolyticus]
MFYVNARAIVERKGNDNTEIIIQTRNKKNEESLELPGGRLELFESILDGLRREVFEETGLTVIEVEGSQKRIDTRGINPDFEVECLEPYCVYQTIKGPVDSIGMYFICKVDGNLLEVGDETTNIRWENVEEVYKMMIEDQKQFSDVDRAGLKYYLKHRFGKQI